MGTTAQKLQNIVDTKAAIGQVISTNGGTVPQAFSGYAGAASGVIQSAKDNARLDAFDDINTRNLNGAITFRKSTAIRDYICYGMNFITSVSAPNATAIGNYAFYGNVRLMSISFPKVRTIGENAFYNCQSLHTPSFPAGLTAIGAGCFQNSNVTSFDFGTIATVPDGAFGSCALSSISASSVTEVGNSAFYECRSLKSINLPNAVTLGQDAFASCINEQLTSVSLPAATSIGNHALASMRVLSFDLPNVVTVGQYALEYNPNLTALSLPSATSIGTYAFQNCPAMETLSLPLAATLPSTSIRSALALSTLSIPSCQTLTTPWGTSYNANYGSPLLTSLSLPAINTISRYAFGRSATQIFTPNLADLYIPNKTKAQIQAMTYYSQWYLPTTCTIHASDTTFLYGS